MTKVRPLIMDNIEQPTQDQINDLRLKLVVEMKKHSTKQIEKEALKKKHQNQVN